MSLSVEDGEERVRRLAEEKGKYALEAYVFVFHALEHTYSVLAKRRHVTGQQLCEGFRQLAARQYGCMAPMVLDNWKLKATDDIGQIVFHLVEAKLMGKTAKDTSDDFHALYDFATAFTDEKPREPLLGPKPRGRRKS